MIAPACVLNVLDFVKVIAVNVPSEFLLMPRLMVSLLPKSMRVVVFILVGCASRDWLRVVTILYQGIASTHNLIFFAFFLSASMSSSCTHAGGSLTPCSYFCNILKGSSGMSLAHWDWLSPCLRRMAMSLSASGWVVVVLVMRWRLYSDGGCGQGETRCNVSQ